MDRIEPGSTLLLVIDVQERLIAALPEKAVASLVANLLVLVEGARVLGVPVVATEQYPKGLGTTVEPLADKLRALGVDPIDKVTFDACGEPRVARAISERAPKAVVVAGVEMHVCVFQTARELARRGMDVRIAADAVASRREENRTLGIALAERAGAAAMPTETVLFDWLGCAGTAEFKALSKLLR